MINKNIKKPNWIKAKKYYVELKELDSLFICSNHLDILNKWHIQEDIINNKYKFDIHFGVVDKNDIREYRREYSRSILENDMPDIILP